MKKIIYTLLIWVILTIQVYGQEVIQVQKKKESKSSYKKRVLESVEMDLLSSLYTQDGENAAVTGGIGTEEIQDATATIIVSIPLNEDDVLTIDAGVSAYTSASSSNINPFDGGNDADAFIASSGESQSDVWSNISLAYSHSSDDRNRILGANLSFSSEYDYTSFGLGGSYTSLFNQKNTEFTARLSAFLDQWTLLYPSEFNSFGLSSGEEEDEEFDITKYIITGNANYSPQVSPLDDPGRNSYALGFGFSQILSKNMQASLALDVIHQRGQLSTPFQRVYFKDVANSYIQNFHLADDIERLPNERLKFALGARLNYYISEAISLRTFYRFYKDDWDIRAHTASIEIPIKIIEGKMTFYPSYRFYAQSATQYFAGYDEHLSSSQYYTSDFDLSKYRANQYGFGWSYKNLYSTKKLWKINWKSIDIKYYNYRRNSAFSSHLVTLGIKFNLF